MWRFVVGHAVPSLGDVSKDRSAFLFRLHGLLDSQDEGVAVLRSVRNCQSNDAALQPKGLKSSVAPVCKSRTSHILLHPSLQPSVNVSAVLRDKGLYKHDIYFREQYYYVL